MTVDVTNADDVTITVVGDGGDGNSDSAGVGGKLVVDSFEWREIGDSELKSGVGNRKPIGASHGNLEYEFSLTLEGEDASLFDRLSPDNDGKPTKIQITITGQQYKWNVGTAWCLERTFSGSDGDAVQYEASGIAMAPTRKNLNDE